MSKTTDLSKI